MAKLQKQPRQPYACRAGRRQRNVASSASECSWPRRPCLRSHFKPTRWRLASMTIERDVLRPLRSG